MQRFAGFRAIDQYSRDRRFAELPSAMSVQEARFWFYALTSFAAARLRIPGAENAALTVDLRDAIRAEADRELGAVDLDREFDLDFAYGRIARLKARSVLLLPLAQLFDGHELLAYTEYVDSREMAAAWFIGIADFVVPYADAETFAAMQEWAEPLLRSGIADGIPSLLQKYERVPPIAHVVAALHLHDAVASIFQHLVDTEWPGYWAAPLHGIVLALGSPEQVVAAAKKTSLKLPYGRSLREWFAATGNAGYAHVARSLYDYPEPEATQIIAALGLLQTPEAVDLVLRQTMRKELGPAARAWLVANREAARANLVAAAEARTREGDVALEALRADMAAGNGELIAALAGPALRGLLFPDTERVSMDWVDAKARKPLPRWIYADALPPLDLTDRSLGEEHVSIIVEALEASTLAAPDPRIYALKACARAESADRFVLALFKQWMRAGADVKGRFALISIGLLGGPLCIEHLVPLVRVWPGEAQHQRAVTGVDVLRSIGSDLAIMHIAALARKLPFAALKARAATCIEEIARDRNLSRERLEDRIVPTFDFDKNGRRELSYCGQTYTISLDEQLSHILVDAEGRVVRDLPKTASAEPDDLAIRKEWIALKKQMRDFASLQRTRFEYAMASGRHWFLDEFEAFIVNHPLIGILARNLLWVATPVEGDPVRFTLRDGTYVDVGGKAVTISTTSLIRVAHRLSIDDDELQSWSVVFADRKQPFSQLDRVTYVLEESEAAESLLTRFNGMPVQESAFATRLRKQGWDRGLVEDGGVYYEHSKIFERPNLRAVIEHDGIAIGYRQAENHVGIQACRFFPNDGAHRGRGDIGLRLRDVDTIALSEVCADLTAVLTGF